MAEENFKRTNPRGWAEEQKKKEKKKQEGFEFKQPPLLGLITRLFRGIKFEIKNIHIRYEDDVFSGDRPFSFGFTINSIRMDTHQQEEQRQRQFE